MNVKNQNKVSDIRYSIRRVQTEMNESIIDAKKIGDKELISKCEAVKKSADDLGTYLDTKTEG
jgi:glutamate synthase domain-containing protein 3